MRVAVLTSSRADYGIYLPLLKAMEADSSIRMELIVFGTHLSRFHGYTITQIQQDGFRIGATIDSILTGDTPEAIAACMALTQIKFSSLWEQKKADYDIVFCLGDRYEMLAAVIAGIPFGIKYAHIHGGETTLGAFDNEFRHCLSILSKLHFTATAAYAEKVAAITGSSENIHYTGSLSLENIRSINIFTEQEFMEKFGIDITIPSILITFHPETHTPEHTLRHLEEVLSALQELDYQLIITMPNADTQGATFREEFTRFAHTRAGVKLVENFGTRGYFSCLQYSKLVLGNSSSGIIEAASFGKYVVNIGDRQLGRAASGNVTHVPAEKTAILAACASLLRKGTYTGNNIYYQQDVAEKIIYWSKKYYDDHRSK